MSISLLLSHKNLDARIGDCQSLVLKNGTDSIKLDRFSIVGRVNIGIDSQERQRVSESSVETSSRHARGSDARPPTCPAQLSSAKQR